MKAYFLLLMLFLPVSARGADTVTIFEKDGSGQNGRPITFGRAFVIGEFRNCLQPVISGTPVSNYQTDVKNRWNDNSVKFAIVSFVIPTLAANSSAIVSFQSVLSCNNTGFLTQTQMTNFNSGNWGAEMDVTANGTTPTANASTMLANTDPGVNSFNDCKNDYWLQGPVVTAVIVQDCTSTTAFDFGWFWNGTAMSVPCTGNSNTCSLHPWFVLYFYPSTNQVRTDMILENDSSNRWEDQLVQVVYKTGNPLSAVLSYVGTPRVFTDASLTNGGDTVTSATASFVASDVGMSFSSLFVDTTICSVTNSTTAHLCKASSSTQSNVTSRIGDWLAGQRYRKTFWTGTGAPGNVLVDHNWAYLISTRLFPSYDLNVTASPDSSVLARDGCTGSDYACFAGPVGGVNFSADKGERGGSGTLIEAYSANDEGAPIQREDLLYLYNMGVDCGTANGKCSEAYYMAAAQKGAADTTIAASVIGGAGTWNNQGNVPYHYRETSTAAGNYFCATQAGKDAVPSSACGSTNTAFGRTLSMYYRLAQFSGVGARPTGSAFSAGNWTVDLAHWIDMSYPAYLLTGDFYYYEEELMGGAFSISFFNAAAADFGSNGFYGFINPKGAIVREMAWGIQNVARSRTIAVDGTLEQTYFDSILASNAEILEGFAGITGTSLTPTSTNPTCTGTYSEGTSNRWNWGRCTVASHCFSNPCTLVTQALHAPAAGGASVTLSGNNSFQGTGIASATAGNPTTLAKVASLSGFPVSNTWVYIFNANGNWPGINGTWQLTNTGGGNATIPFNSSAVVGTLNGGNVGITWGSFGKITGVTPGNPTTITTNQALTEKIELFGFVDQGGTNYSQLNGIWNITSTGANTATVPFDSTGFPAFTGTTAFKNDVYINVDSTSDYVQPWMEHFWELVLGEIYNDLGFTYFQNIALDQQQKLTEEVKDPTYNPYLIAEYIRPLKNSSGGFLFGLPLVSPGTSTLNPYFTTWAQVKAAFTPQNANIASFTNSGGVGVSNNCTNHGYGLVARAAGQYIGGVTSGGLSGTAAQTWMNTYLPYFNNTPPTSTGCGTSDEQIKFALAPRVAAPTTSTILSNGVVIINGVTIQ